MFTSNQVLKVSGTSYQLKLAVSFAMEMSGQRSNIAYQKKDGIFILGGIQNKDTKGWTPYNTNASAAKIAEDIKAFLEGLDWRLPPLQNGLEYWQKGFLMTAVDEDGSNIPEIENKGFALVKFEPFNCYYDM